MINPPFLAIMSKSKRYNKILNKIVNINEDYSQDTSEQDQYELGQSEADSESSEYIESGEIEGSSGNEEEHFLKVCRNKKRCFGYAKRNIISGCVSSDFELILGRYIMRHIEDCTETEARRVLKKDGQSQC